MTSEVYNKTFSDYLVDVIKQRDPIEQTNIITELFNTINDNIESYTAEEKSSFWADLKNKTDAILSLKNKEVTKKADELRSILVKSKINGFNLPIIPLEVYTKFFNIINESTLIEKKIIPLEENRIKKLEALQSELLDLINDYEAKLPIETFSNENFRYALRFSTHFYMQDKQVAGSLANSRFLSWKLGSSLIQATSSTNIYKAFATTTCFLFVIKQQLRGQWKKELFAKKVQLDKFLNDNFFKDRFDNPKPPSTSHTNIPTQPEHPQNPILKIEPISTQPVLVDRLQPPVFNQQPLTPKIPLQRIKVEREIISTQPVLVDRSQSNVIDPRLTTFRETLEDIELWETFISDVQSTEFQDRWWKKIANILIGIIREGGSSYVIEARENVPGWDSFSINSIARGDWGEISFVYILCERLFGNRYAMIVVPENDPNSFFEAGGLLAPISTLEQQPLCRLIYKRVHGPVTNSFTANHFIIEINGREIEIPADGHCLYRSIAEALRQISETTGILTPSQTDPEVSIKIEPIYEDTITIEDETPISLTSTQRPGTRAKEDTIFTAKIAGAKLGKEDALNGYEGDLGRLKKKYPRYYQNPDIKTALTKSYFEAHDQVTDEDRLKYCQDWAIKQARVDALNGRRLCNNGKEMEAEIKLFHPLWNLSLASELFESYQQSYKTVTTEQKDKHAAELGKCSGIRRANTMGALKPIPDKSMRLSCFALHPEWEQTQIDAYEENYRTYFEKTKQDDLIQAEIKAKFRVNQLMSSSGSKSYSSSHTSDLKRTYEVVERDWNETAKTHFKRSYERIKKKRDIPNRLQLYGYLHPSSTRTDRLYLVFRSSKDAELFCTDIGNKIKKVRLRENASIKILNSDRFVEIENFSQFVTHLNLTLPEDTKFSVLPQEECKMIDKLFDDSEPSAPQQGSSSLKELDPIKDEPITEVDPIEKDPIEEDPIEDHIVEDPIPKPISTSLTPEEAINNLKQLYQNDQQIVAIFRNQMNDNIHDKDTQLYERISNLLTILSSQQKYEELSYWKKLLIARFHNPEVNPSVIRPLFNLLLKHGFAEQQNYDAVITRYYSMRMDRELYLFVRENIQSGFQLSMETFDLLQGSCASIIRDFIDDRQLREAITVFEFILAHRKDYPLNEHIKKSLTYLFSAISRKAEQLPDLALECLEDIESLYQHIELIQERKAFITYIRITIYLSCGFVGNAIAQFDEFVQTYSTDLTGHETVLDKIFELYIKNNSREKIEELCDHAINEWHQIPDFVYCNLVSAFLNSDNQVSALYFFRRMTQIDHTPNKKLIPMICRLLGSQWGSTTANEIYQYLKKIPNWNLRTNSFHLLIRKHLNNHRLDLALLVAKDLDNQGLVLDDALKRRFTELRNTLPKEKEDYKFLTYLLRKQ